MSFYGLLGVLFVICVGGFGVCVMLLLANLGQRVARLEDASFTRRNAP